MALANRRSGTKVQVIADGTYRINTPVAMKGSGGFAFNQYLVVDDEHSIHSSFSWRWIRRRCSQQVMITDRSIG